MLPYPLAGKNLRLSTTQQVLSHLVSFESWVFPALCILMIDLVVNWSLGSCPGQFPPAKEIVILVLELLKLRFTSFVTFLLIWGIFLGLAKSVLQLSTRITYLGLVVDTSAQAFFLPQDKVVKFAKLSEAILASKKVIAVKTL